VTASLPARIAEALLPPVVALIVALVCGDLLILLFGQSPRTVYARLLDGALGNPYGVGQVLYKTTTLTFAGLAVAVALRAGLFNIGAESQIAAGAFAAAVVGLALPAATPMLPAALVCLVAAGLAGGAVGWVPGVLRAKFGAHEVIVTIMLNFIVLALLNWIVASRLHVPETLHTPEMRAGAVPALAAFIPALHGSAVSVILFVALIAVVWAWWYLFRTRSGYELRAVGLQPDAAEYGGISVGKVWIRTMALSGLLAGLAGTNFVLGYKHYYEEGFQTGSGCICRLFHFR
jgi:general nucleoside transport system permease protein